MIVAGRLSQKMAPVVRQLYDQMPEPKWVISMGACATSGGVFNNYAIVQGCNQVIQWMYMCRAAAAARGAAVCDHAVTEKDRQRKKVRSSAR